MANDPIDEMITVKEAADILGISERGVIKAIERGRIIAQKFGESVWALSQKSVLEYRDTRTTSGPKPKN